MKNNKNILNKYLEMRITDVTFKIMFLGVGILIIGAVAFLLYQSNGLKESYETIAKQKSITILDENGNVFKKRLYETNSDIATIFGLTYIKKALGYGYLNYNRILNFVKIFSSEEVSQHFLQKIKKSLKQLIILNGTYIVKIEQFKLKNKEDSNKEFTLLALVEQELISESKHSIKKLVVRLKIDLLEPTSINSSGMFVTKFEIENYDTEKHQDIFK